jgi:hypothetical protein
MHAAMIRGCVDSAGPSLPAGTAQAFCDCTIGRLTKEHTFEELDKAFDDDPARRPTWVKEQSQRNARQCADSLGLEITFREP